MTSTGPIESGVIADLESLDAPGTAGLRATAVRLARTLDGDAGLATAAVARELRATLTALAGDGGDGDDDAVAALVARLSAPVQ